MKLCRTVCTHQSFYDVRLSEQRSLEQESEELVRLDHLQKPLFCLL